MRVFGGLLRGLGFCPVGHGQSPLRLGPWFTHLWIEGLAWMSSQILFNLVTLCICGLRELKSETFLSILLAPRPLFPPCFWLLISPPCIQDIVGGHWGWAHGACRPQEAGLNSCEAAPTPTHLSPHLGRTDDFGHLSCSIELNLPSQHWGVCEPPMGPGTGLG